MKTYIKVLLILSGLGLFSCEQEDPEIENTATYPVSGEWYVTYQTDDGTGQLADVGGGYSTLLTFNTAANIPTEMWLSDQGNFKEFQVKVPLNIGEKSFAGNDLQNLLYPKRTFVYNSKKEIIGTHPGRAIVENGRVLLGQGLSTSKVKTDSIYLEVLFDDDTTSTGDPYTTRYIVSGHRRTGFLEDEH